MNRFYMTSLAATLALAMSASTGLAQESTTFDLRGDLSKGDDLDFDTFQGGFDEGGVYDAWDTDRDEMISRDEFNRGVYTTYDANQDDVIDDTEYEDLIDDNMFRRDWRM